LELSAATTSSAGSSTSTSALLECTAFAPTPAVHGPTRPARQRVLSDPDSRRRHLTRNTSIKFLDP
jgi:hypothetical protein